MKLLRVLQILVFGFSLSAMAGQKIEYKANNATMESYISVPKNAKGPLPAIMVVPDWMGVTEETYKKVDEIAAMGYVAMAVDVYGKDVRPKSQKEAGMFASKYKNDIPALRERINAALTALLANKAVNPQKVVALGYCFGGTTVLELGRSGAAVAGIVSFHGGLATPKAEDAANIKSKVLVLHGAIDPFVAKKEVSDFQEAMDKAGIDYQFVAYSGAVHSFTNKKAGSDIRAGAAYNENADKRSWVAFKNFLAEVAPL